MTSLRAFADKLDLDTGDRLSVLTDLFGFQRGRLPVNRNTGEPSQVSLLEHIRDMRGRYINLNYIKLGYDKIDADKRDAAYERVDYAVYRTRKIFRLTLGVGRVEHYAVPAADAMGFDNIGSDSEAHDVRSGWSVSNDGIDCFFARAVTATDGDGKRTFDGKSPNPGSCDKDSKGGALLAGHSRDNYGWTARTAAHEVGHYLGLNHSFDLGDCPKTDIGRSHLMATRCPGLTAESTYLTPSQREHMRRHCMVRGRTEDEELEDLLYTRQRPSL